MQRWRAAVAFLANCEKPADCRTFSKNRAKKGVNAAEFLTFRTLHHKKIFGREWLSNC
jgi:hypothetical protein